MISSFLVYHSKIKVFQALQKAGLQLKPTKCLFAHREVKYLRHIVSEQGIKPDPDKLKAVSDYLVPKNITELRQFLGLSNYPARMRKG